MPAFIRKQLILSVRFLEAALNYQK